jgi:phage terminase large subunit-like protein
MTLNAEWVASLPRAERERFYRSLSPRQAAALKHQWHFWARPKQIAPPGDWVYWLILAGRGFGKTRSGAELVREWIGQGFTLVNLAAATADDARDIMVEGESGILAICLDAERPRYLKNDRKLLWPSGAVSLIFTADEPDRFRGKQHMKLWADELASWRYVDSWNQAQLGLRLGSRPQAVVTTTPRATDLIVALVNDPTCIVTSGTTYENKGNLAKAFFDKIIKKYEGTRLGQQELLAQILSDNPDALWSRDLIDRARVLRADDLARVIVAVDPQAGETGAETGIIIVGIGKNDHGYVLDDMTIRGTPNEWGTAVAVAYDKYKASLVVAEENQGGKMVQHVIQSVNPAARYKGVRATEGKRARAEPVAALYEQGRVHHVGTFAKLEDQMCQWTVSDKVSPDRIDALVWGITAGMVTDNKSRKGFGL